MVEPLARALAHREAIGRQPLFDHVEDLASGGGRREFHKQVSKRVQHHGTRAHLSRYLFDGSRRALGNRFGRRLVLFLGGGKDHQGVFHRDGARVTISYLRATSFSRLSPKRIDMPDQESHLISPFHTT
ncbi:MAG TPA: hypothetical protein VFN11_16930 [Ktedonobacterales bacterium]|nr:hypothetical protein [Ktedonobacterales bacterium]